MKYLSFNRLVVQERGIRAENTRRPFTALYRNRRMLLGLVGYCGHAIPRVPEVGSLRQPRVPCRLVAEDHEFSDEPGSILSWSADALVTRPIRRRITGWSSSKGGVSCGFH
jgi:hypothetical protein